MSEGNTRVVRMLATLALLASLGSWGCASEPPELTTEAAHELIVQQFPEAEPTVLSVALDEEGASAQTEFNGELVDFLFSLGDEGWWLESVEHKGQVYFIKDLEHISGTMVLMSALADALARYHADHGAYPVGEGPQAREVMVPDYLPEDTEVEDAWGNRFTYFSEDGEDYTLVSFGPDRESGTVDDLILHTGEFVAPEEHEQGSPQRKARKNSLSRSPHSASRTPPSTSCRCGAIPAPVRSRIDPQAPRRGSLAP